METTNYLKDGFKDIYYGSILDPIHGQIKLSEIEKWVISQKPFNRLKRIKQNTFLYYVFPSAHHTRFEHSLGVMHLAGKIFDAAMDNCATGRNKRMKHSLPVDTGFFDLRNHIGDEELSVLYQELRLAALLHDVGHGPMSHLFDNYTISKENFERVIENDTVLSSFKSAFQKKIEKKGKIEHEIMSCLFVIRLINDLKKTAKSQPSKFTDETREIIERLDEKRVIKIIEHDFPEQPDIIVNGKDITPFLTSIISSFPIDADRMDYLLRDSYFSGVKYGIYDLSRIFMSFVPALISNKIHLVIKESGIDSVIRFIQSRTHLFNQVYYHKTNRAANVMLDCAVEGIETGKQVVNANTYEQLEEFYWQNSDELFLWTTIRNQIEKSKVEEKEIFEELLLRKLFKRLEVKKIVLNFNSCSHPTIEDFKKDIEHIKLEIQSIIRDIDEQRDTLRAEGIFIKADCPSTETFKDEDKSSIRIARKQDKTYTYHENWSSFNTDFKSLNSITFVFRIYMRRNFNSSSDFLAKRARIKEVLAVPLERLNQFND